ncbi:AraC family transcriptional regulator [Streptomyces erythrochromogenes]|uniref:AraC family transcriptional regulator n=1 Tax=Streptomyces erythrochromogenes TaxID=285574 RepID=UPI0036ABA83A
MSLDELRDLLSRHARPDLSTAIDGVRICRAEPGAEPEYAMSGVVLAVIAQGAKRLALGDRVYEYGVGQYLVASADLPVVGRIAQGPELGFGMTLEPAVIAELMLQAGPGDLPPSTRSVRPGITISNAPGELIDAIVRLLRLLDRPRDRRVLVPLAKREILWLLMTGEQGEAVRQLGLADSGLTHITRAVGWIRDNYAEAFRVEDLARSFGMSASAFHRNFQAVTAMSPIQFQKQIRLQAARLLLARRPNDVTGVASSVGYDSPSQFSREYKRQFGAPPRADAARMWARTHQAAVATA